MNNISTFIDFDFDEDELKYNEKYFIKKEVGQIITEKGNFIVYVLKADEKIHADFFIFHLMDVNQQEWFKPFLGNSKKLKSDSVYKILENLQEEVKAKEDLTACQFDMSYEMLSKAFNDLFTYTNKRKGKISKLRQQMNLEKATKKAEELVKLCHERKGHLEQELIDSQLKIDQINLIQQNAHGICLIQTYLENHKKYPNPVVLGLKSHHIVDGVCQAIEGEHYMYALERLFKDPRENPMFLNHLTNENQFIVFLVPRHILSHPSAGATAREMNWFLNHPEKMKNVLFVFGAYDLLSSNEYTKLVKPTPYSNPKLLKSIYRETVMSCLFKNLFKPIETISIEEIEEDLTSLLNTNLQLKNDYNTVIEEVD